MYKKLTALLLALSCFNASMAFDWKTYMPSKPTVSFSWKRFAASVVTLGGGSFLTWYGMKHNDEKAVYGGAALLTTSALLLGRAQGKQDLIKELFKKDNNKAFLNEKFKQYGYSKEERKS